MTPPRTLGIAAGISAALLAGAFLAGRYSRPARVETHTVTQTQTVDRIVYRVATQTVEASASEKAANVETRTEWRYLPGQVVTVTQVVHDVSTSETKTEAHVATVIDHTEDKSSSTRVEASKIVLAAERPNWSIAVMPGLDVRQAVGSAGLGGKMLGAAVERRVLGPIWLGAWGATTGTGGISVRLEF
jgi:hypothetical protein